jgi:hypothetical protein
VGKIIIRNDDVSPNTDYRELMRMYAIIEEYVPDAEIWSVWCPVCQNIPYANRLYRERYYPLRGQTKEFFMMQSDRIGLPSYGTKYRKIASHGMMHIDHRELSKGAQMMSIVTSCYLLKTHLFVPPFSEYNSDTEEVCKEYGVRLVKREDGWKSLESTEFDPKHGLWFFHSWRYTPEKLKELFDKVRVA